MGYVNKEAFKVKSPTKPCPKCDTQTKAFGYTPAIFLVGEGYCFRCEACGYTWVNENTPLKIPEEALSDLRLK